MSTPVDKELIFCLQAVQMGLADARTLVDVGLAWSRGDAASLREELVLRGAITAENARLVDQTVELILTAHRGDVRASLESLGGGRPLESLGGALSAAGPASDAAPGVETEKTVLRAGEAAASKPEDEEQLTPEQPGRYRIKGERGRGGMGRVLVAFDEHAGREIAIKELLVGDGQGTPSTNGRTTAASARFLREARLTAKLEHPSIVPVYEVGRRADGTLYYTMRLVRGRTLAVAIAEAKGLEERLGLLPHFANLCSAIAYAHSRGVLHRDIKPQNAMIGELGETVVLDWGLAKARDSAEVENRRFERKMEALRHAAEGETVDGEAFGTPEYMPPEQAWGELARVDEHSDVYSLGAVLYEILTGKPPFSGEVAFEVIGRVQRYGDGKERLTPVLELEPKSPPELAAIATKALAAEPASRYPSAKALLEDVNAFMSGRRVGAYEYSGWELIKRLIARHRVAAGMAAAMLLLIVAGSGAIANAWRIARAERATALENARLARRHLSDAYTEKAAQLASERDLLGAKVFAAAALLESPYNPAGPQLDPGLVAARPQDAQRQLASIQSTLWAASQGIVRLHAALEHERAVLTAAFSPDGSLVASGGLDERALLWRTADGSRVWSVETGSAVTASAFSADGKLIAVGLADKSVRLLNAADGSVARVMPPAAEQALRVAVTSDGAFVACSSRFARVWLWNTATGKVSTISLEPADGSVNDMALTPDSRRLIVAGPGEGLGIWDLREARLVEQLAGHAGPQRALAVSPDGSVLASVGDDEALYRWSLADGRLLGSIPVGESREKRSAIAFQGNEPGLLAIGQEQGVVDLVDAASGRRLGMLRDRQGTVRSMELSADGSLLATLTGSDRLHLWRIDRRTGSTLVEHRSRIRSLERSEDGRLLALTDEERELLLWDLQHGKSLPVPEGLRTGSRFLLSPDSRRVALYRQGTVAVFGLPEGKELWSHAEEGRRLVFSPNGRILAIGAGAGAVRLLDVENGMSRGELATGFKTVSALAFSPNGERLAAGGLGKEIEIWDLATRQRVASFATREESINSLEYSPDGAWLAAGGASWAIRLLGAANGEEAAVLEGHTSGVRALSFSKDGSLLASSGMSDGRVILWDTKAGRQVQTFSSLEGCRAGELSSDGKTLLLAAGPEVRQVPLKLDLWSTAPGALLKDAEREAGARLEGFGLAGR